MEMRALGRSGLQVSSFGFGVMTFGDVDNPGRMSGVIAAGQEAADRQVAICLEAGVNLFDTADVYAEGRSEEILGRALGARRKDVIVATKGFYRMGPAEHDMGLSRRHLIDACDASLRRLGTDWIDLYQVHAFDGLVPLEETLEALDSLVRGGKVRYIGCSNYAGWQLMKALAVSDRLKLQPYVGQQIQYSLAVRDAEHELLPCGLDQGVGALIWSPMAQGFLSGKFRKSASGEGRLDKTGQRSKYNSPVADAALDALLRIADVRQVSPGQVALNWVRARPGVTSVLVGASSEGQLLDNLAAQSWSLTEDEMATLDRASQERIPYPADQSSSRSRNPLHFPHY